jgi:hypothetical protein
MVTPGAGDRPPSHALLGVGHDAKCTTDPSPTHAWLDWALSLPCSIAHRAPFTAWQTPAKCRHLCGSAPWWAGDARISTLGWPTAADLSPRAAGAKVLTSSRRNARRGSFPKGATPPPHAGTITYLDTLCFTCGVQATAPAAARFPASRRRVTLAACRTLYPGRRATLASCSRRSPSRPAGRRWTFATTPPTSRPVPSAAACRLSARL